MARILLLRDRVSAVCDETFVRVQMSEFKQALAKWVDGGRAPDSLAPTNATAAVLADVDMDSADD